MRKHWHFKEGFVMLSLAALFWLGASAYGQNTTRPSANGPATSPQNGRDNGITNNELANTDRFLDRHPEIAEQLQKNPSLINNREFVENHPALQQFLQDHPMVREEVRENPNAFFGQENRYHQREENREKGMNRGQMASMDRFLDGHPEIAEQLRKNPSLANNREFLENHPALQSYLKDHPEIRDEIRENPNAFMKQENRFDRQEDNRDRSATGIGDRDRDRSTTGVGDRDRHDPVTSVGDRDRSATGVGDREPATAVGDRDNRATTTQSATSKFDDRDRDATTSFGRFLQGHSGVAADLTKNPSLANNQEYMSTHPELGSYLKDHPEAQHQLSQNPQAFVKSAQITGTNTRSPNLIPKENY